MKKIGIIGARHSLAQQLIAKLIGNPDLKLVVFGRDRDKLHQTHPDLEARYLDLTQGESIAPALVDCEVVVSFAHAKFVPSLLLNKSKLLEKLIVTGSTWKFTQFPNPRADEVRQAEEALRASSVDFVMLHPSMIYGIPEEKTVNQLMDWVKKYSFVPLPSGGHFLVQPAFRDDIVEMFYSAIFNEGMVNRSYVIASHKSITYRDMIKTCARLTGQKVRVLNVPRLLMYRGAQILQWTPIGHRLRPDQVLRLTEDKAFDVSETEAILNRPLHSFEEGMVKLLS